MYVSFRLDIDPILTMIRLGPDQDPSLTIFMLQMTSSCPDGSQEWATCVQKYIGNQINMNYPMYAIFWNLKVNQKNFSSSPGAEQFLLDVKDVTNIVMATSETK